MPHKHRLSSSSQSALEHDLPPSALARPLSVTKAKLKSLSPKHPASKHSPKPSFTRNGVLNQSRPTKIKRKRKDIDDDTPRAFTRLLSQYHPPPRSGLDDGAPKPSKKRKTSATAMLTAIESTSLQKPAILPGESLRDYSARVDAAIPVAGLAKGRHRTTELKDLKGLERRQTKAERKMQRMQKQWREEEARRKAKRDEEREEAEKMESGDEVTIHARQKTKKGKRGKSKMGGDVRADEDEEDPWAAVAKKRMDTSAAEGGGLVGLHDVVLAPPKLAKLREEKLKVGEGSGGMGVGLKRQAELSETRRRVVEGYRAMMKERSAQ